MKNFQGKSSADIRDGVSELFNSLLEERVLNRLAEGNGRRLFLEVDLADNTVIVVYRILDPCLAIFAGHAINGQNSCADDGLGKLFMRADGLASGLAAAAAGEVIFCTQKAKHDDDQYYSNNYSIFSTVSHNEILSRIIKRNCCRKHSKNLCYLRLTKMIIHLTLLCQAHFLPL